MNLEQLLKDSKQIYFILKLREIKHRLTYVKNNKKMAAAMERFHRCTNKKLSSQVKKEMSACKRFWGCYPLHYYRYDLYRKDRELSESELLNYIPEFFFYNLFLPFHDSEQYIALLADKNISEQIFRSVNISQAHTICKLISNHMYSARMTGINYKDLEEELAEKEYPKIFVKPVDGQGGTGIYIFERNGAGQYVAEGNRPFDEEFLNRIGITNNYIIQSGIEQDPELSGIYPHSVNAFRIATENKNGKIHVLCCTLKSGKDGKQVDNAAQGGIILTVDINTGQIGDYATSYRLEHFERHPDTGFVYKGYQIPRWGEVKNFALESAAKLPQFTYLGWDIALAKDGPLAIETNLRFGLDHYQVALGGLRQVFQIDDPQFYWRNRGERGW